MLGELRKATVIEMGQREHMAKGLLGSELCSASCKQGDLGKFT